MRTKLLLAVLMIVICIAPMPARAQGICYTDKIDTVDVVTLKPNGDVAIYKTNVKVKALRQAILGLSGRQTWVGYNQGGFDPVSTYYDMLLIIHWADGTGKHTNYLWFGGAPGRDEYRQIYWFPSLERFDDGSGQHMGEHPNCGWNAIEVSKATEDNLRRLAGVK